MDQSISRKSGTGEHSTGALDGERRPLRVLIVAPSLDILGGQAVQAARLLTGLRSEAALEVDFLPINPRLPGPLRQLQAIKYVRTVVTSLLYSATLLLRVRRYDVIHVFSAAYFSFVLAPTPALLVARLYGKKIVLNYHSGEAEDHLTRWPRSAISTIRLADEVAVPSDYLVRVFAGFGFQARAIFNTIDTRAFRFRARKPLQPVFLSNRNLELHYGVDRILRAFAIVQQHFPAARLTVAGDGSQRVQLEALARELKLQNVNFTGRIEHENVCALYDDADVYLNGSEIDNQPLSLLEAFACGLPVVTTDAGGIPYIVTHEQTGLLVGCGDYEAMAREAMRLLHDVKLAECIMKQALDECQKYSWAAVRNQWLELYDGLGATLGEQQATGSRQKAENRIQKSEIRGQKLESEVVDQFAPK
jgi:glycosyltransferase involved in cell wall biosynthesis